MTIESGLLNLLVSKGVISEAKKSVVVNEVEEYGKTVIDTVINLNYAEPKQILGLLAEEYFLPTLDLAKFDVKKAPEKYLNEELCLKYEALPVEVKDNTLYLAISDPSCIKAIEALDAFSARFGIMTDMILAREDQLQRTLTIIFRKNVNLAENEKQEGSWYD